MSNSKKYVIAQLTAIVLTIILFIAQFNAYIDQLTFGCLLLLIVVAFFVTKKLLIKKK